MEPISILIMIVTLSVIWGGLIFFLLIARRKEYKDQV